MTTENDAEAKIPTPGELAEHLSTLVADPDTSTEAKAHAYAGLMMYWLGSEISALYEALTTVVDVSYASAQGPPQPGPPPGQKLN